MNGDMVLIRVPGELTEEQRDGRACVFCGSEDAPAMVALGMADGDWLFMCSPACRDTGVASASGLPGCINWAINASVRLSGVAYDRAHTSRHAAAAALAGGTGIHV